jgi:hypothetical protein
MHRLRRRREGFEVSPALPIECELQDWAIECTGCASPKFLSSTS